MIDNYNTYIVPSKLNLQTQQIPSKSTQLSPKVKIIMPCYIGRLQKNIAKGNFTTFFICKQKERNDVN